MRFYIAKVTWYCEGEEGPLTDYLSVAGESFDDIMSQLSEYYQDDELDAVEIKLINYERPLVRLPDEQTYEAIKERGEI